MSEKYKGQSKIHLRYLNFRIILYVLTLSVLGVLIVNSATRNEVAAGMFSTTQKQIIGIIIGIAAMIVLIFLDYHFLVKYAWAFYLISFFLLVYVKYINPLNIANANRWIRVPGFGTIQPSEFSKVAIAVMAVFLLKHFQDRINNVLFILVYFILNGISVYLIYAEPDMSTSLIIVFGLIVMIFIAGISWKWVFGVSAALCVMIGGILYLVYQPEQTTLAWMVDKKIVNQYQVNRVNAYFFPDQYPDLVRQQLYSVIAIGGGQLSGKGLNNSTFESVKNGNFLSQEQTDMIFAVVGEELGFIGSSFIILLYFLLFMEGLRIAARSPDEEGKILAGGLVGMMAFQCFVNMGVAMLILPNTGTPLPFISAGMSSLISCYMMIGIILNIGMQRKMKIL